MPPAIRLDAAKPRHGQRFYLDTSAVIPLALARAGTSVDPVDQKRHRLLRSFSNKVTSSGGVLLTSLLAFEELAAVVRRPLRDAALKKAGASDWRDFRRKDAAGARQAEADTQKKVVQMMEWGLAELAALGGAVELPSRDAAATRTDADLLFKAHVALLRSCAALDPMDALHVVVGSALNTRSFVSFDRAWERISTIELFGE